jgi:hypothetical protein
MVGTAKTSRKGVIHPDIFFVAVGRGNGQQAVREIAYEW